MCVLIGRFRTHTPTSYVYVCVVMCVCMCVLVCRFRTPTPTSYAYVCVVICVCMCVLVRRFRTHICEYCTSEGTVPILTIII
jgi:hypothetical protein